MVGRACYQYNRKKTITKKKRNSLMNIEKEGKHTNQLNEGPEIKVCGGSRTQGRRKNSSLLRMDFPTMVKSDIPTKGVILYPQPHTLRHRSKGWYRSGWNGDQLHYLYSFWPLFFAITGLADMYTNLADYGRKLINITYIWDAWLCPYFWISPHYHPDGNFYWDSQGPQQWSPLVIL